MWQSELSVDIDAPIEKVYERLKDFTRDPDFSGGLIKIEQTTSGPIRVGARFRAEERVPGKYTRLAEITALDEPRLIAWKASVEGIMRTEWEFRLSPTGTGTHLVQTSSWQASGPIGFLMLNLHRKRNVPRENRRTLDRIRSVLESEATKRAPALLPLKN
jgi:uncharacterized membrane protein